MASSTTTNSAAAWLFVGAILIGGVTAAYLYTREPEPTSSGEVAAIVDDGAVEEEAGAAPETGESADAKETETAALDPAETGETAPPRFDILRVEQDGSAVIAGTAPVGSMVFLLANGEEIASGTAGDGGDFAIVLDEPLAKGDYELTLQATGADGKSIVSKETGVVSVPEEGGELLAMVTEEGKASRVMQAPSEKIISQTETVVAQPQPTETPSASETASAEMKPEEKPAEEKTMETASLDPGTEAETAPTEETLKQQPVAADQEDGTTPVLVQAVDVDGGRMFIAGTGAPDRNVNIYLDEDYLGTTKVSSGGTFLLEADKSLDKGTYTIRADMLAENGSTVARRASVQLQHEVDTMTAQQGTSSDEKPVGLLETARAGLEAMEKTVEEKASEAITMAENAAKAVEETAVGAAESAASGIVAAEQAVEEKASETMAMAKDAAEAVEERAAGALESTASGLIAAEQAVEEKAAETMAMAKDAAEAVEERAAGAMESAASGIQAVEEAVENKAAEAMESAGAVAGAVEKEAAELMETAKTELEVIEGVVEEKAAETMAMAETAAEAVEEEAAEIMEAAKSELEVIEEVAEEKAAETMAMAKSAVEAVEKEAAELMGTEDKSTAGDTAAAVEQPSESQQTATLAERMEAEPSEDDATKMAAATGNSAAADETQAPVIKSGASVIIRRGDNLWRISRRMLGRGIQYTVIYEANRDQITDPNLIFPGQVFDVPGAQESDQG